MNVSPVEANAELIRTSVTLFNGNDIAGCVARLAPDFAMHLTGLAEPLRGPDAWREGATLMKRAFPDLQIEIEDLVAADDRVAVRLTLHGTQTGDYLGLAATGRTVRYASHEFYRLANGLIAEEWICSDNATLFQQLGGGGTA